MIGVMAGRCRVPRGGEPGLIRSLMGAALPARALRPATFAREMIVLNPCRFRESGFSRRLCESPVGGSARLR